MACKAHEKFDNTNFTQLCVRAMGQLWRRSIDTSLTLMMPGVRTMDLMFLKYNMPLLYQSKSFALKVIRELRILLERILDHFEPQFLGSRYNRAF